MNLTEALESLHGKVSVYRFPNLDEELQVIKPVLEALEHDFGDEIICDVRKTNDAYVIAVASHCWGETSNEYYGVPYVVVEADDPIKAAKLYKVDEAIKAKLHKLAISQRAITSLQQDIDELMKTKQSLES